MVTLLFKITGEEKNGAFELNVSCDKGGDENVKKCEDDLADLIVHVVEQTLKVSKALQEGGAK